MEEKGNKPDELLSPTSIRYRPIALLQAGTERDHLLINQPTVGTRTFLLSSIDAASVLHYDPSSQRLIASDGQFSERALYLVPSQMVLSDHRPSLIQNLDLNQTRAEVVRPMLPQIRQSFQFEDLPSDGQLLKSNLGYYFLPNSKSKQKLKDKEVVASPDVETEFQQVEVCEELVVPDNVSDGSVGALDNGNDKALTCKDCGVVVRCNICSSENLEVLKPDSCDESSNSENERDTSGDDNAPLSSRRIRGKKKKKMRILPLLFHCTMCIRSFRSRERLISHKKAHGKEEKNFSCFFCGSRFRFEKNYLSHLATHNPNSNPKLSAVSDSENQENTAEPSVKRPVKGRPSLEKVCHICQKTFKNRKSLKDHIILHSRLRPFSCDVCARGFPSRRLMRRHRLAHNVSEKKHACAECGESFRRPGSLKTHMTTHLGIKPYECETCKMRFNSSSHLSRHKKSHLGLRPYVCEQCKRAFSSKHHLQRHVLTVHLKEKRFACDKCDKRFPTMSHLQQHSVTHSETRPFKCDFCEMSFTCNAYRKKHVNITHAVNKPFQCEMCSLSFSSNYHLKRHQLIHSGTRPFACDQCGVGFLTKYALQRHTAVHTGIKPHHCDQCPASFAFAERLKQHLLTHTQEKPFCCHICGARFNLKCSLDQHTRKHTGEQPFVCPTCNRKFSSRSSLSRHRRVHTGARPYPCEVCGKGLSSRRALRRHYQTHQQVTTTHAVAPNSNSLVSVFPISAVQQSEGQLITPLHMLQAGRYFLETLQPFGE